MYHSFGMSMPGRTFSSGSEYRYGFNGQEKSDEIFEGATTALFWEYDSRTGRRWNVDPVVKDWESPYLCFGGSPIFLSDPFGNDNIYNQVDKNGSLTGKSFTVKTGEKGGNRLFYFTGELKQEADIKNLKLSDFDNFTIKTSQFYAFSGYEYDGNTNQFVKSGMAGKSVPLPPSQSTLNQKQIPTDNKKDSNESAKTSPSPTSSSPTSPSPKPEKPTVEKVFDGIGAVGTFSQAAAPGFKRGAEKAMYWGTKSLPKVTWGIAANFKASKPNILNFKVLVSSKMAIAITKSAKVIDGVGKIASVGSGIYNIVKEGKLTPVDAGVAVSTALKVGFPVYGFVTGVYDIMALGFGWKSSDDLIHDAIDWISPKNWSFKLW